MADVTLDDLIARARLESGLRQNAYYDSGQIIRYLNAGGAELYDIFTTANQHYVISEFDFTTTGQSDAVVDLPEDFQQGHSLEIYPDLPGQTATIKYLSNWLNRNAYIGNAFPLAPGGYYPVYTFLGRELRFYPPACTPAAPFRLYYTPMWVDMAAATTPPPRTVDLEDGQVGPTGAWQFPNVGDVTSSDIGATMTVTGATNPENNGTFTILAVVANQIAYTAGAGLVSEIFLAGVEAVIQQTSTASRDVTGSPSDGFSPITNQWTIADANFNASDVGAVITAAMPSPNTGFNGEYTISSVLSPVAAVVVPPETFPDNSTFPFEGAFVIDRRVAGKIDKLPGYMAPWSEYLVVYAAIAINTDRQRSTADSERKLNALKGRINQVLAVRQEEPVQPPLTRGAWNDFGGGWGGGWGGGFGGP